MRKKSRKMMVILMVFLILIAIGVIWFLRWANPDFSSSLKRVERNQVTKKLIICVDGVPWRTIHQLWEKGHFKAFHQPSKVIVAFPTMTNVTSTVIWSASKVAGYESAYFDKEKNHMVGGVGKYLHKRVIKPGDFHQHFDYLEPVPYEFIIYVLPRRICKSDLKRFLETYSSSEKEEFCTFIKSTDGLMHILGKEGAEEILLALDDILQKIYHSRNHDIEIMLFSDHGFNFAKSQRVKLKSFLKSSGFDVRNDLRNEKSVILPSFGLVSFAAIYTRDANKRKIAQQVPVLEGVDFCAYRMNHIIHIFGQNGEAKILKKTVNHTDLYKYEIITGDPLSYKDILERLTHLGKADDEGYIPDSDWFEATKDHPYVNALMRLHQAFSGQVESDADILISLKDGYFHGSALFSRIATILGTHGSLLDTNSVGFFMSTAKEVPSHIRDNQLIDYLK
ncbi:MAG: alkaline phosphatase family protein [Candidatus Aminicenantes bacterium]|nr:alkaline phosphatase family protein [Candidatus Aminicenantes bacterium]